MKFLCVVLLSCLINALIIEATYYDQGVITTYRVRRSGVKSTSGGQYVQQRVESSDAYDRSAQRGGVRALPSRLLQPRGGYQQQVANQYQYEDQQYSGGNQLQPDAEPAGVGGVQGVAGKDYPAYTQIPNTRFSCSGPGKNYAYAMYADEEAQCQVYHVCFQGRKESFLCGVGTVFNQAILACDYWHSVECSRSREFYSANEELGKASAEPASGGGGSTQVSGESNQWRQQQQQQPRPQPSARQQYQQQPQPQQQYRSSSSSNQYEQSAVAGQWSQQQQRQQYKSPAPQYPPARQTPARYQSSVQSSGAQQEYSGQQVVQSVSQYSDQAAVRAQQLVAQPVAPQRPVQAARPSSSYGGGGEQRTYRKSKYSASGAVGNQLSPSARSKALSQVQQQQQFSSNDGQYVQQQQQQQPYRAPQQQRPYKLQPSQVRVDTFRDTQQKLIY